MHIAALAWSLSRYWRVTLVAMTALLLSACQPEGGARQPIRIGVLHSLSGSMATSERPLVDAVRLAVEEINADGGLLGRPVEIVLADGASDWPRFAAEAERLISQERVSALFACWTSACRKAVKPVVEKHQHLMFYPVQYEGLEISPNLITPARHPTSRSFLAPAGRSNISASGFICSARITFFHARPTASFAIWSRPAAATCWASAICPWASRTCGRRWKISAGCSTFWFNLPAATPVDENPRLQGSDEHRFNPLC
jgi:hypothetical protein